ncbi:MAG: hypothetical protein IKS51_03515 [Erysipelotrichaceae bacterium]|nr:hypothetical protein [Erysipelotrichaceae bacterium]
MSVIATVYIPEGIIMAADSRVTGSFRHGESNMVDRYTLSDNGQKVFLLTKKRVGISACGNAEIGSQTVADCIREFESAHVSGEDTIEAIAENLKEFVHQKKKDAGVIFHVAGYDGDEQRIFEVRDCVTRLNADNAYNASWSGDISHLTDLINGKTPMVFDWNHMYLKDGIELAEFMIDVNCKAQRFSIGVATCGGPIDILLITKDQARWIRHKILNDAA